MYQFNYKRASSVSEAADALKASEDGMLLAGGQTLIPTMKQRLAQPSDLIDIGGMAELTGVSREGDVLVIKAATTHFEVSTSDEVKKAIPGLADLAAHIGDPAVRHRGTIGGSLANNDPSADYPAGTLALGATIVTTQREIAIDDFFDGMFSTALEEGEIITAVKLPIPEKFAYAKFPNPASRYAMVGVAVAKTKGGVRVAATGAGGDGVFRVTKAEAALSSNFSADAVPADLVAADDMIADIHGSGDYRAHLVGVMTKRAVAAAG